jgi:anti-sigma regulatory factor (Ser/Thr protein kinase)
MFVTCPDAIIDVEAGEVVFANAGHNLPYVRHEGGVLELRATGMPLGLMPGMGYDEAKYDMAAGEVMVLTSDGITEAHNAQGEMYGFGRLMDRVARRPINDDVLNAVVSDLEAFTGDGTEQEDYITLVVVKRTSSAQASAETFEARRRVLAQFSIASEEGNERVAIAKVAEAVEGLGLESRRLEQLKTAVGETVMNAIEHGNENRLELDVDVEVCANEDTVSVRITDQGGDKVIPEAALPDIEAKLSGEQTPRGWGLFLIEKMVDEVRSTSDGNTHTIELVMNREGAS